MKYYQLTKRNQGRFISWCQEDSRYQFGLEPDPENLTIRAAYANARGAQFEFKQYSDVLLIHLPIVHRFRMRPNLIIFDLYGTLIQFGVKLHPFRKVLQWARQQGRSPKADDARFLMTHPDDPTELFSAMGIFPPSQMITQLQIDIEQELASLTLFDDVIPTIRQLSDWHIPIAVCSNLAKPYGAVIEQLLPDVPLLKFLSYDVGYIKPEREIYQCIVDQAKVDPAQCLFVGDTLLTDYEGPTQFGFRAKHLIRGAERSTGMIGTLADILALKEIMKQKN